MNKHWGQRRENRPAKCYLAKQLIPRYLLGMNKQLASVLSLQDALLPCAKTSIMVINTLERMRNQKCSFSWSLSLVAREHSIDMTKVLNYITLLQLEHLGQKAKTRARLGQILKWIKFVFRNFYLFSHS